MNERQEKTGGEPYTSVGNVKLVTGNDEQIEGTVYYTSEGCIMRWTNI